VTIRLGAKSWRSSLCKGVVQVLIWPNLNEVGPFDLALFYDFKKIEPYAFGLSNALIPVTSFETFSLLLVMSIALFR
jgi:hypothetical protein